MNGQKGLCLRIVLVVLFVPQANELLWESGEYVIIMQWNANDGMRRHGKTEALARKYVCRAFSYSLYQDHSGLVIAVLTEAVMGFWTWQVDQRGCSRLPENTYGRARCAREWTAWE